MLLHILFAISLLSVIAIFLLSLAHKLAAFPVFWPPPSRESWQHKIFMLLFRLYLYPLIGITILGTVWYSTGLVAVLQWIGIGLIIVGFGAAIWITHSMGWRNAFGEKRGLVTGGWFGWSRNPVYVVTWLGLVGWALMATDVRVYILIAFWALMYLLAPFLEEPWLEREYGEEYRRYKKSVPRFF